MSRRPILSVLAAAALAFGLAACGADPVPVPEPLPAPETPAAVITEDRLTEVLGEIQAELAAADAASSTDEIGDRVTGPALEMREAEYALAAVSAGTNPVTPLSTEAQVSIVSATSEWPRVADVVTAIPEGTNLPLLITLVQEGPRDPYALWSWVRLFPGVSMPTTTAAATGSAPVAPDSADLRQSPEDTIAAYVDVLNNGEESASNGLFADEPFRTGWSQTLQSLNAAVEAAGEATQSSAVSGLGSHSIATHDGGAIVVGAVDQTLTVQRTVAGATLSVGPNIAYGGDAEVAGSLTATYLATVAFYVPPAGSEDPVVVLGAEQVLKGVERDDSVNPDNA